MASDSTGTMITVTLSPSSGTLSVGGVAYATYTYGPSPTGKAITVYIIHEPSKQKMFSSSTVVVEAGLPPTPSPPSAMLTVTAKENTATLVKITIYHEGGDDLTFSDLEVQASDQNGTMQIVTMTLTGTGTTLRVGGKATGIYDYGDDATGKAITVYIIHTPSNQKMFSSSGVVVV
jgi:FlaG/FlaF family flagellin (archaellin)